MTPINGLTAKLYSTSLIEVQSQKITSVQAFSFTNAHSCEQRLQTCHKNKASQLGANEESILLTQAVKTKTNSNLFTFATAQAAPIEPHEKILEQRQMQAAYSNWYEKGAEKPKALNRKKRAFEEGKITLEQIVKVSFEQYLGIGADFSFQELRDILSKDLSQWAHLSNPDAERFKDIKTAIVEILKNPQHAEKMSKFLVNTIGAFHMSAMENNVDFRRAYMFYMHENEKSIKEKGSFFYHADVENLFPASYQANNQGVNYFQQIPLNIKELDIEGVDSKIVNNSHANIYALLLHYQSLGKPLNYKSLAMAFAHIDIVNYAFKGIDYIVISRAIDADWIQTTESKPAVRMKLQAIRQYYIERNLPCDGGLVCPLSASQYFNLARFITANVKTIRGICHYLTMSVMMTLAEKNLDAVASAQREIMDFYKLSESNPIAYFRIVHQLEIANDELYNGYGTTTNYPHPILAKSLYKNISNVAELVELVFNQKREGYTILAFYGETGHNVGIMPIQVGNEVIHYYFDPSCGLIPCLCKEHLIQIMKQSFKGMGVQNVNDANELKKVGLFVNKLTDGAIEFFKSIPTSSGIKFHELNKQALSQYAKSHALSNEDWSSFFLGFNKGETLYNKNFDSLEEDAVYKALKTDTSFVSTSHLYVRALQNLQNSPISADSLSTVTISEVLEREKLFEVNPSSYHNAAQALELEAESMRAASSESLERSFSLSSSSSSSSSLSAISDRDRFSVSLNDMLSIEHTSTQNLGQSILSDILESSSSSSQNRANAVASQQAGARSFTSRIRNVFTGCFGRLGRNRAELETEFYEISPHFTPSTVGHFLDDLAQEDILAVDLDAVDLETHKINQKTNQINTKIAQILQAQGLTVDDYRFSPAENLDTTNAILLYQKSDPSKKFSIDLNEHSQLASLWQQVKTAVNARSHNFAQSMTSYLSDAQRANLFGDGWKAVGHVSNTGSKFLSLYALTTLGEESHFFQQSHLEGGEKMLRILNAADLVLNNGANAASIANGVVKRLFTPSSALSKISRFGGKASNGVSLITQGFELGFYSYAYAHSANAMEREVAKLMVATKSFQSALSVTSMVVCAALPQMSPIFMMLGLFISYVENAALTKTISKETANQLFEQFAGELEFIKNLLENPKMLFNEQERQITVVSAAMPYSRLVVTAGGIQMKREAKPFAVEFTENFRQTASQYKGIVFREPGAHAGLPIFDYDNMPVQYQDYKEMLQNFGRGFKQGFSLSPETDDIREFTGRHERGRAHFINQESSNKNGTFSEEIAERTVVASNIAECLMGEEEQATPIYTHLFANREANDARNIVIKGHPVKPVYQSNGCIQAEVNGYSYAPRWNEVNKLDKCDILPNGSTKLGDFWKIRKVKQVYRNTDADQPLSLYKGKLAFKETSYTPHLKPSSAININQWKLETSWKTQTCYENPNRLRIEVGSPQYILKSGGVTPNVYHFVQDEFVENLKHLHAQENDPAMQVTGHQVYGLYSDFPISNSDVGKKSSWFDITLVPDGNTFLHLYPNTYLNISESEAAPSKGDIHFMLPYQTLRNGRQRGQQAVASKISNSTKELILMPQTNQPIHIKLNNSVKRAIILNILKELPNKTTAVCGVSVSFNEKGGLTLELNQISQIPLGNIASTTAFVNSQIKELKAFVPRLLAKAMRIHSLDLTKTPYHQEKSLDTSVLSLAPIWEKVLNQTLTQPSSKDKTKFVATGWYLVKDENIKTHSAVQKNASLMIPKIWRDNLPLKVQKIIERMVFVGFARESMEAVPADVKSAIVSEDECYSYHFFDPQTRIMIRQWGATEIRFWDSRDITLCAKNRIPQKVFWSGSETENYSCDAIHISPPTETMGGAEGRVAIMVEGNSSKLEFAAVNAATNKKFLDYIFDKSLSAVMQRAEADSSWNPKESDIDLQNLMIHVQDINLKHKDQSVSPVQVFLLHDKEPKLALVPKGEGLLAIPKMQNYAITAAVAENSTDKPVYKLYKRALIASEVYKKINTELTSGTLVIDEADLPQKVEIKQEFQLVGIKNAPLDNAIICHTAEGIAMALDYDLKHTKLLGISNDYLVSKNIALNEEMAILAEYQALVNRIGSSAFPYLNLYRSDESNPEQPSIFVNTKTAIPTLVYVPVFYQEYAKDRLRIKKQALSKRLNVISDTNDIQGQTKRAVVQDVVDQKIYTVWRSNKTNSSLGDVFPYTYIEQTQNGVFLGLNQHVYTPLNYVELPKMNIDNLSLLPCDKEIQKQVVLGDWMLTRLKKLTVAKPIYSFDYVQQIALTPSQLLTVESIKPLITKDALGRLQLSLLLATRNKGVAKGSELIRINLENAINADAKLHSAFIGCVRLHDRILNLQQLADEAYADFTMTC